MTLIDSIEAPNNKESAIVMLQQKYPYAFKQKNEVVCPFCGSTQIQIVNKKWDLMTGLFTNKTLRVCVKCNKKF